jgi:hypothetical protein
MFPSIQPFTQVENQFHTQLTSFEQGAQQGFPLSTMLNAGLPGGSPSAGSGAQPQQPSVASGCSWWDLTCQIGSRVAGTTGSSWTRILAFILGLISVAGAIYLFKPEATTSIVKKGAALAS